MATGFLFTDTRDEVDCPRCGAKAGDDCIQPKGRKQWPPHRERLQVVMKTRTDLVEGAKRTKGQRYVVRELMR